MDVRRGTVALVAVGVLALAGCSTSESTEDSTADSTADATEAGSDAVDEAVAEALSTCEDAAASEAGDWFACSQAMQAVEVSDSDVEAARDKVILWADQLGTLEDPDELLEGLDEEEAAEVIERQIAPLAGIIEQAEAALAELQALVNES